MEAAAPYAFFTLLAVAVIGLGLSAPMHKAMKERHPSLWNELGKPGLLFDSSFTGTLRTQRYLWKKGYVNTADRDFVRLCTLMRTFNFVYLVVFAATLIVIGGTVLGY